MKEIEVVAAVIENDNFILCVQRPFNKLPYISNKFEFPGGKVEDGEDLKQALARELTEELNLNAPIKNHIITVHHTYPDFKLKMHAFHVSTANRKIELKEHISATWLQPNELMKLDWAAADLPIVKKLIN